MATGNVGVQGLELPQDSSSWEHSLPSKAGRAFFSKGTTRTLRKESSKAEVQAEGHDIMYVVTRTAAQAWWQGNDTRASPPRD